ncbi:hypothetical protein [Sinimarinibacterium thermocellulolyticum]|uniref:Uncharacterized protein n=1 Tax=Sinimarinibacterium thermocellulolyticum TaxID=3170016 RepID=A0ABV2AB91_9GAMM
MRDTPLVLPRRLAIQILHAAQTAAPHSIRGVVTCRGGGPERWRQQGEKLSNDERVWAELWSHPQAAAIPQACELTEGRLSLIVSLDTKGVLQMRAWLLRDGVVEERKLQIRD